MTCSELYPNNASTVVYACVIMHNLLIARRPQGYLHKVAEQANPMAPDFGKLN